MAQMYAIDSTTPSLSVRVAAEVRAWRGRLNISQAEVGKILGLSQGQVSARLLGKVEFSFTEVGKLAQAWGISEAELMGYGPQTPSGPPPGIRGTGGGVMLISPVAPATGLEPVTCREQSWDDLTCPVEPDLGCLPSAA
jgi:predicted XRE-type DNA-binding protein